MDRYGRNDVCEYGCKLNNVKASLAWLRSFKVKMRVAGLIDQERNQKINLGGGRVKKGTFLKSVSD